MTVLLTMTTPGGHFREAFDPRTDAEGEPESPRRSGPTARREPLPSASTWLDGTYLHHFKSWAAGGRVLALTALAPGRLPIKGEPSMTDETTLVPERRWRVAAVVFATAWTVAGAALLIAGPSAGEEGNGLMIAAGLMMLLGAFPLWKEVRA